VKYPKKEEAMPNLHPLIVHFPIALIFVVLACDIIAILLKRKTFFQIGTIISVFALLGAVAAVITGLIAEDSVWHAEAAHEILGDHKAAGLIFLGFSVLYTIFRFIYSKKINEGLGWLSLLLVIFGCSIVTRVGYLGGQLVYTHGTGVKAAELETVRADSLSQTMDFYRKTMDQQMKEMDKQMQRLINPESLAHEHHH
jgi:uncharacterized membrane protein